MSAGRPVNPLTGRAVIIALDHGIGTGVLPGLESPVQTLRAVLEGPPDGVLVGPHFARRFAEELRQAGVPVWITLDFYGTSTVPGWNETLELYAPIATPSLARELGGVGVKAVLVFGRRQPEAYVDNLRTVAAFAEQALQARVPLMVEAVLWGARIPEDRRDDPDLLLPACRVAFELGADLIKVPMPRRDLHEIVAAVPVPIMILGGAGAGGTTFLNEVAQAMAAGARGVVCGRAVWQSASPASMVRALRAIVHEGRSVEEASKL